MLKKDLASFAVLSGLPCRSIKNNTHDMPMFEFGRLDIQFNHERGQATIDDVLHGSSGGLKNFRRLKLRRNCRNNLPHRSSRTMCCDWSLCSKISLAFPRVFCHIPPPLDTKVQYVRKDPLLNDISALETFGSGRRSGGSTCPVNGPPLFERKSDVDYIRA